MPPLLSICIPSYKGANYLRVSLGALLPQVRRAGGRVEVLVIDDASPDETTEVLRVAGDLGPVRHIRNPANLGSARNIVQGPLRDATGEFICIWSQHCLIHPGALDKLLGVVERNRSVEAFHINFRCAQYPGQWPREAVGGYDGPCDYVSNPDVQNRPVVRWESLLNCKTGVGTQSYAHVFARSIWLKAWAQRTVGNDFEDAWATYPHTCALAVHMFGRPSYYIGEPLITIFNGAQWWGSLGFRAKAYLRGFPDLLDLFRDLGWSKEPLSEAQAWGAGQAGKVMTEILRNWSPKEGRLVMLYVLKYWRHRGALSASWNAFLQSECCRPSRALGQLGRSFDKCHQYCFHNCRPARWLRRRATKVTPAPHRQP